MHLLGAHVSRTIDRNRLMKLRKVRHRTLPFTVVALLRQLQLLRRRRGCRGGRNRSRHTPVVIRPRPNRSVRPSVLSRPATVRHLVKSGATCDRSDVNQQRVSQCTTIAYVFNSASLAKPHAIDQLAADLSGYKIDIAVITETHFKPSKHPDSMMNIAG